VSIPLFSSTIKKICDTILQRKYHPSTIPNLLVISQIYRCSTIMSTCHQLGMCDSENLLDAQPTGTRMVAT